ncbi:MAG TPA: Gfo/Idh/MocA family oxidoreductase [Candidatus Paceibacterota bacterium]|nr:Gfo/Idh/MocA family oxidoreductase [Verrucomicrobiota bacterium]HSA12285.1 Gfo/Idh/MocA family oxidoreductase [Candidatus Paceibacterota bacterium]
MKRRAFLKSVTAGLAMPCIVPRSVFGAAAKPAPNDRIAVGVIGCGGRVSALLYEAPPQLQVVALADCDLRQMSAESVFGKAVKSMPKYSQQFATWKRYQDYSEMLEKEKLDAVFVTTTTHARALACIHAVQAKKDVYAEKPLTLTIEEGQVLVKAVRKHGRVLQVGTQCRTLPLYGWVNNLVRTGGLGRIEKVIAHNFEPPVRRESKPGQPVPKELNWDMWCNQTPLVPYDPTELHPSCPLWGKWWEYDGGGLPWGMTGWGTHSLDMIQAALGTDYTGPVEVWPDKPGDALSPIFMRYADGRRLEMTLPKGHGDFWGAIYHGEKGRIEFFLNKVQSDPPELVAGHPEGTGYPALGHMHNWIDCMRTRKRPNADVEIAHRSSTLCHLANIARELGRRLRWNPDKEEFVGDAEANALKSRPRRKGYELPKIA